MSKYDKASLVHIPSGYKNGTLYNVLPNDADGDFDFFRGSTATRVNKDGLIETAAIGVPRLDYPLLDGVVQDCPALLLEPVRANKFTYSEDFSQSVWNELRATITANSTISPDGSNTATLLKEDTTASDNHIIYYGGSLASSTYSMSVFAKAKERTKIGLGTGNISQSAIFDLSNGTIIDDGAHTASISYFGNGWYRCNITTITTTPIRIVLIDDNNNTSYTGDGVSGLYIWGAQAEDNAGYVSSYIPTSGSAVTRSADVCNGAEADFNDSEGVLFAEISALTNIDSAGGGRAISISNKSYDNRVVLYYSTTSNNVGVYIASGTSQQVLFTHDLTDVKIYKKFAVKYKANDFSFWVNGFELNSQNTGITPVGLNTLQLADGNETGAPFLGKTKQLMTFNEALSDTELEDLTSWDSFREMATEQLYTIE